MRALALVLVVLLVVPALAAAKSIVYITKQNVAGQPCTGLSGEDRLFCQRLQGLGYEVNLLTEDDVRDDSGLWHQKSVTAGLIFLGDVSQQMVNLSSPDRTDFCNRLWATQNQSKKMFAAFLNARKKGDILGCAFDPLGIVSFPADDNSCTDKQTGLFVLEDTYVTRGFARNQVVQIYNASQDVWIHGGTQQLAASCDPPAAGLNTGFYSTVAIMDKGTFWGMDKPSQFTDNAWKLFDRTVLLTTGDNVLKVDFFTIPELVTANKTFMLFAQVTGLAGPVKNITVTASADSVPLANLTYSNVTARWENRALKVGNDSRLIVSTLDGSASLPMKAGELDVQILSGNYQPGLYTVRVRLGPEAGTGATVKYRIWNSNLAAVRQGELQLIGGTYKGDVDLSDLGDVTLEITATTADGKSGGAFRTIRSQVLNTTGVGIDPASWVVTATKTGTEKMSFKLNSPGANLTSLKLSKIGTLAPQLSLDVSGVPEKLWAGGSATFSVTMDWSSLPEGAYSGEILVDSDQIGLSIPITLNRFNLLGDFMTAQPDMIGVQVTSGGKGTTSLNLSNSANLPATGLKLSMAGELAGHVSIYNNPYFVPAYGSATIGIAVDTSGLNEGTYSGVLKVTSSLGEAEVVLNAIVGPEIGQLIERLETDYATLIAGRTIPGNLLGLSQNVNSSLEQAKLAAARGDASSATNSFRAANASYTQLRTELLKPPGLPIVPILVLLVAIGAGVWYYLKRKKEKEEERKKAKLPEAEEKYRFEYY